MDSLGISINTEGRVSDVALYCVPFWVRIYALPSGGLANMENMRYIGNQLGKFIDTDQSSDVQLANRSGYELCMTFVSL